MRGREYANLDPLPSAFPFIFFWSSFFYLFGSILILCFISFVGGVKIVIKLLVGQEFTINLAQVSEHEKITLNYTFDTLMDKVRKIASSDSAFPALTVWLSLFLFCTWQLFL